MSGPTLSIITTVYDRVECLGNALRSTRNLNFQDWEQIVVADAPPPDVLAKLERVVEDAADPRITFHNLAARANDFGITPAETGLRAARGKYVAFLDDDNVFLPHHFDGLLPVLESDPTLGFVFSACLFRGERVLSNPVPKENEIDLGQVVFRRTAMGESIPRAGYPWDWHLIHGMISRGSRYRFVDQRTFLFRHEPRGPFEADAQLAEARIKAAEHDSAMTLLQNDLSNLRREGEIARAERDSLREERDTLREERDAFRKERDELCAEGEGLRAEHQKRAADRSDLIASLAESRAAQDSLRKELDRVRQECDVACGEREVLRKERDALQAVGRKLEAERSESAEERSELIAAMAEVTAGQASLRQELEKVRRDGEIVREERNAIRAERDLLRAEALTFERNLTAACEEARALRASLSWRVTAPLRRFLDVLLALRRSR